jgi:hypothetical protein
MRRYFAILAVFAALLAASLPAAAQSLQPLYKERDPIAEPALVGTWEVWGVQFTFEEAPDNAYRMAVRSEGQDWPLECVYEFRVVRLGGHLYFDASFQRVELDGRNASDLALTLPIHIFGRVSIEADTLTLGFLRESWFENEIEAGRLHLRHERVSGDLWLTASTEELQQLFEKLPDEALESNGLILKRVTDPEELPKKGWPPCTDPSALLSADSARKP